MSSRRSEHRVPLALAACHCKNDLVSRAFAPIFVGLTRRGFNVTFRLRHTAHVTATGAAAAMSRTSATNDRSEHARLKTQVTKSTVSCPALQTATKRAARGALCMQVKSEPLEYGAGQSAAARSRRLQLAMSIFMWHASVQPKKVGSWGPFTKRKLWRLPSPANP